MATIGRKNVHGKGGVRFKAGFTSSKKKSMLRNTVTDLIIYGKVEATLAFAKELSAYADRLVTYGKKGDLNSRRLAAAKMRPTNTNKDGKTALQVLFNDIAPAYKDRNGGYTRILKTGNRLGDAAEMVILELVEKTKKEEKAASKADKKADKKAENK